MLQNGEVPANLSPKVKSKISRNWELRTRVNFWRKHKVEKNRRTASPSPSDLEVAPDQFPAKTRNQKNRTTLQLVSSFCANSSAICDSHGGRPLRSYTTIIPLLPLAGSFLFSVKMAPRKCRVTPGPLSVPIFSCKQD